MNCPLFYATSIELIERFGRFVRNRTIAGVARLKAFYIQKTRELYDTFFNIPNYIVDLGWMITRLVLCLNSKKSTGSSRSSEQQEEDAAFMVLGGLCVNGPFSFANADAHSPIQERAQLFTGLVGTFFGIFDGHNGDQAAAYVQRKIFSNLVRLCYEQKNVSRRIFYDAIVQTEKDYLDFVREGDESSRCALSTVGTCCLIGLVWKDLLFVANLGDSQAVLGRGDRKRWAKPLLLTSDHSTRSRQVRREYQATFPKDPSVLVRKNSTWRVKGLVPVARSIGDSYLKYEEFRVRDESSRFYYPGEELTTPLLRSEPQTHVEVIEEDDRFVIAASHGFWQHVSIEKAVRIVESHPREGIAGRLIETAIGRSIRRSRLKLSDVLRKKCENRRRYYDDMTVIVIFLDRRLAVPDFTSRVVGVKSNDRCIYFANDDPGIPSLFSKMTVLL